MDSWHFGQINLVGWNLSREEESKFFMEGSGDGLDMESQAPRAHDNTWFKIYPYATWFRCETQVERRSNQSPVSGRELQGLHEIG